MEAVEVIEVYQQMQSYARQMLMDARKEAWADVARSARQIRSLSEERRFSYALKGLTQEQKNQRHRIMMEILEIDHEIRSMREPWTAKIDSLLMGRGYCHEH